MQARDIMTPEPMFVTPRDPVAKAAGIMRDFDVGIVPVVDSADTMRVEGVITDRDIAVRCVAERHDGRCEVARHMTTDHLDTVQPDADVERIVAGMERDRVRRVLVVDGRNHLVGIVAQADIARALGPVKPMLVEELLEAVSTPRVLH